MASTLVQKLTGVRDLKKILEATVKEIGEAFTAEACQIVLSNPLDPNVTNICEYRVSKEPLGDIAGLTLPLSLQGKAFGHVSLARRESVSQEEVNAIRVMLAELGDIIRYAQINDIVQRDTFRDTFLVEIGNVMAYSLGIGDALFMVVNILGKVLNVSRCIFVCTDDTQTGWRCYEYWQQGQVKSCREYCWPTTDSAVVSQTLLSEVPIVVFEGQENSYITPVQEEVQFIGARSILGVGLRTNGSTHGCVILQQCDQRRSWTRGEIDMVQNVADKVAEALAKLPAEKKAREPIMQLHQRVVTAPEDTGKASISSVRRALKGALGQQAIPVAQKTSQPVSQPVVSIPPPVPHPQGSPPPIATPPTGVPLTTAGAAASAEQKPESFAPPSPGKSLSSILGGIQKAASAGAMASLDFESPAEPSVMPPGQPVEDYGQSSSQVPPPVGATASPWGEAQPGSEWSQPVTPEQAQPEFGTPWGQGEALDQVSPLEVPPTSASPSTGQWGNVDAIPTPATTSGGQWGNLDAIPTPAGGPARAGLGGAILGKVRGPVTTDSPLLASFHKDKSRFSQPIPVQTEFVEGPPIQIDENAAQAKLQEILSSANPTSDYIFATPGLDARMLGRIDGWVSQIEQKDKYLKGHARQVAEYACSIAQQIGLSEQEVNTIRLAALVHDVGKLGASPQVLQKPDEELSDSELLVMMKHPLDGAELLESFPELKHLAPIVRSHHEEYDGNGYPAGLKGEEIPLAARIICVANSYHALTSPLKDGAAMSASSAQEALTKGAGKQWEPRLVEALLLCIMQQKVPPVFQ
ncbi:MAG: HD domain-containing protein [Candidatus Melainabacteria bacterium]|nr:HD domain-containing protein [Candidatus Melainabacteria bacterium]